MVRKEKEGKRKRRNGRRRREKGKVRKEMSIGGGKAGRQGQRVELSGKRKGSRPGKGPNTQVGVRFTAMYSRNATSDR